MRIRCLASRFCPDPLDSFLPLWSRVQRAAGPPTNALRTLGNSLSILWLNNGMVATGNHLYFDSLRGAPPSTGSATKEVSFQGGQGPRLMRIRCLASRFCPDPLDSFLPLWSRVQRAAGPPTNALRTLGNSLSILWLNNGMVATSNHLYFDSLRGAPPSTGAAS